MTPDQAAKTVCPFSLSREKVRGCQGPACHLWRWSDAERSAAIDAEFSRIIEAAGFRIGNPTAKPTPQIVSDAKAQAQAAVRQNFQPTQGACALRGEK